MNSHYRKYQKLNLVPVGISPKLIEGEVDHLNSS
jgi:hypothetical protein